MTPSPWPAALRRRADRIEREPYAGLSPVGRQRAAVALRAMADVVDQAWEVAPEVFAPGVQIDRMAWPWRHVRAVVLDLASEEWLVEGGAPSGDAEQEAAFLDGILGILGLARAELALRRGRLN